MTSKKKVEEAVTESRFVVIDGVQYSRPRAIRLGLLKVKESAKPTDGPSNSRARSSASQRTAVSKGTVVTGGPAATPDAGAPAGADAGSAPAE